MRPLTASELLRVWEQALPQPLITRLLLLLAAAWPEQSFQTLAELSIGQRDGYLLTLREWTFGPELVCQATCPTCGERLELRFNVAEIRVEPSSEPAQSLSLQAAGYEVSFRLPSSLDLLALIDFSDPADTQQRLLERCLLVVLHNGQPQPVQRLPEAVTTAVATRMAQVDPQADVQLTLSCPACSQLWAASFDIGAFFWAEINAWAYRILREVHLLASAYGWSETDILTMSPWKRQFYLKLILGA